MPLLLPNGRGESWGLPRGFVAWSPRRFLFSLAACVQELTTQGLDSAGLDVFDPEPLPVDHPLLKLENVVLAPHRGSGTAEASPFPLSLPTPQANSPPH